MSTLLEIETATETLPKEQLVELFRFLVARLHPMEQTACQARLVDGPNGILLLESSLGAPPMTTQSVKQMLEDFP